MRSQARERYALGDVIQVLSRFSRVRTLGVFLPEIANSSGLDGPSLGQYLHIFTMSPQLTMWHYAAPLPVCAEITPCGSPRPRKGKERT